ncbi:MAG: LPS assembly protein LptD [Rhodocyclales bacterium]|nr:LPS assembly protein LptD [Rhodocyclales bacterium]
MHASARLALVFALGLSGTLRAAENLPLLRVDPALLGSGAVTAPPPRPAEPSAAEAKPVQAVPQAPPAREETVARPAVAAPAQPERRSEPPVPVAQQAKPPVSQPVAAEKIEPRKETAASARPAAPKEAPKAAASVAPQASEASQAQIAQPPLVEEQPALQPLYSAHADAGLVPALRPAGQLSPLQVDKNAVYPTFIAASRLDGRNDNEVVAQGEAELRKANTSLTADRLTYWKVEDEMEAVGNVRLAKDAEVFTGPKLRLNMTDYTGSFEQPSYSISKLAKTTKQPYSVTEGGSLIPGKKLPSFLPKDKSEKPVLTVIAGEVMDDPGKVTTASGTADRIQFQGHNHMRLTNATYSTCAADDPDWYARVAELSLDYDREVGEGRDASVVFKGVPLFYTPWLSFSLNNKRKSGLLAPTIGSSTKSGLEFALPYYWDIAPNMDATITPREMSKRGLQINGEFRYLNHDYRGQVRAEWLPNDKLTQTNRYGYSIAHNQNFGGGLTGTLNLNGVSDATYLSDLHTRIGSSSQVNLLRQGTLSYSGGWWWAGANVQRYQTLQNPLLAFVDKPYERVPQLTLMASRPEFLGGTAFAFTGEYVNFDHPTKDTGRRLTFYPQLSLPLQTAAWHLTPKIGLHTTRYDLNRVVPGSGPDTIVRSLPILSVDSGVAFEREVSWFGHSLAQTLEPRLYYLLVPQRNQDKIPQFDTGAMDFNFATIFSDNVYSGVDRIADANQLTAALTSRLIDPQTGEEYVRGMVGQRYYFAKQQVTLQGESARPAGTSDFLAALSGRILPNTFADVAWQYDPRERATERFAVGGRWQPDFAKVLNASYRYTRDHSGITGGTAGIRQVDFSGQWPLGRGWYGVGRFNYSLRESKIVETLGGLEYNGGCWVGRVVLQRYATATGDANKAIFVQLELNDFAKIGSNPLELLARRIPGYGLINKSASDPVFGYD